MIKHLGSVVHIHSSGIVETDKGNKYPYSRAKIGDVMFKEGMSVRIVSKEVFKKEYAPLVGEGKKAPKTTKPAIEGEEAAQEEAVNE